MAKKETQLQAVSNKPKTVDTTKLVSIETFQKRLNQQPNQKELKKSFAAKGKLYLPISFVETTLDEMFFGQWWTQNFTYQVVANEIIGSLEFVFIHPVTDREIRRVGAAAVMIQTTKGMKPTVENKITNTLGKDFPKLKASCLSNAAKSLGKLFGRDLQRDASDSYQPIVTPIIEKKEATIIKQIQDSQYMEILEMTFEEHNLMIIDSTALTQAYTKRKKELRTNEIKTQ